MTTTISAPPSSNITVESFHRIGPDKRSVSFDAEGICDVEGLRNYLRREQRVLGSFDAEPVVLLLEKGESHMGTVATADADHMLATIELAIRALEAVRDGLLELGHRDFEAPALRDELARVQR